MRRLLPLILSVLLSSFAAAQDQSGIEGTINVSPAHGGPQRVGVPDSRPMADAEFIVSNERGEVATFKTDAQGKFRVSLGAGHYTVARKGSAKGIGHCGPFDVDVVAGQFAKVDWMCDSGMR